LYILHIYFESEPNTAERKVLSAAVLQKMSSALRVVFLR